MIRIIGQATQKDGTSPVWTLTGICTSASRTGTGTYTITCSKAPNSKFVVLISAERSGVGTERTIATWSSNVLTIKNYTGQASTTLGDCWLTVTFLENLSDKVDTFLKYGSDENRITYKAPSVVPILLTPMTTFTWPSMSNGCFTINGNTVTCLGINGFRELLYKTFTVEESGNYTLELDWTSPTGLTLAAPNDDYWNRFGLYIDTSLNINYDGGYQGAMSQGIIMQRSDDTSVITKSQSTTVSLTAGTTYYVWLSYSILADNRNQTIEFTKLQLVKQF